MAKPLKIFLIVIGVIFGLLLSVAIALPLFFNPNNYRGQIQTSAKDATGRELTLGDIKLSVFPWIAIKVSDVSVANAEGFGAEPFAQLAEADASVKLLPLLSGKIEIGTVTVKGLHVNLAKDKTGKDNWSDLSKKEKEPEEKKPEDKTASDFKMEDLRLGGIDIEDAQLNYADAQAGKSYKVEKLNLKTGALEPNEPFDIKLGVTVQSTAPQMTADMKLEAKLSLKAPNLGLDGLKFNVDAQLPDLKAQAELSGAATGDLDTQIFDISSLKLTGSASGKSIPAGTQKFALDGTLHFDAKQGAMKIANMVLQAAGLTINTEITGEGLLGDTPKVSGPIKLQQFSPRDVMTALGMAVPATADATVLKAMAFSADFSGGSKSAQLSNMKLTLDQTTASGKVDIADFATMAINFAFKVDALDADRYLPPPSKAAPTQAPVQNGKKPDMNEMPLPADTLNNLNVQGTLDVAKFKLSNVSMTDAQVKLAGGKGQVKNQTISAKLYGGNVSFNHRFTPGAKPGFNAKVQLSGLQAGPFLKDFMGKDYVDGTANYALDAGGSGLKVGDLIKTLNGTSNFKVENGAVKGFNLASIVRKARATLKGDLDYTDTDPPQTDFTAMTGSATITNGVIKSDDLNAASPLFRVTGAGTVDLVQQTIDYLAKPTVVETSQGQGGKGLEDLHGIVVPVRVSGNLFAPSYKLDLQEALKQQALSKVNDKIKDKLGSDNLKDQLGKGLDKLFKKH